MTMFGPMEWGVPAGTKNVSPVPTDCFSKRSSNVCDANPSRNFSLFTPGFSPSAIAARAEAGREQGEISRGIGVTHVGRSLRKTIGRDGRHVFRPRGHAPLHRSKHGHLRGAGVFRPDVSCLRFRSR